MLRTCVLIDELVQQERPGQAWPIVSAQVGAGGGIWSRPAAACVGCYPGCPRGLQLQLLPSRVPHRSEGTRS